MSLNPSWQNIVIRLVLSVVAGAVIGINRGQRGRPAGMRTTLLVCLAAAIAMVQANLLLNSTGKWPDSFVVMDVMRFPLGILSGMGFIGAGTILRRENMVVGITTAATLWFVTVMGLCFGGGQIVLGLAAMVLGIGVLWGLEYVERLMKEDDRSILEVTVLSNGPADDEIRSIIEQTGCRVMAWGVEFVNARRQREIRCQVRWKRGSTETIPPQFVARLSELPGVARLKWEPQGLPLGGAANGSDEPAGTPVSLTVPR